MAIYGQLNNMSGQAITLRRLARLLFKGGQLNTAKEAPSRAIDLLSIDGDQFEVCRCHRALGEMCHSKGETEVAIGCFEVVLGIASSSNWHDQQFWILHSLADLFFGQGRSDDAHAHIECANSHAVNGAYLLSRAAELQARFWRRRRRAEEAESEVLHAIGVFEKLGATGDVERCRRLHNQIAGWW